jgi:hypothetical protein
MRKYLLLAAVSTGRCNPDKPNIHTRLISEMKSLTYKEESIYEAELSILQWLTSGKGHKQPFVVNILVVLYTHYSRSSQFNNPLIRTTF